MGRPRLTALDLSTACEEGSALRLAAALQAGSEHPLARAVLAAAAERAIEVLPAQDLQAVPGRGIEGLVDGRRLRLRLGSLRWMEELGVALGAQAARVAELQQGGATLSALAEGDRLLALLAFADTPRAGAREALAALRARPLRLALVSGDNRGAALAMGALLGLQPTEVQAEVLPAGKVDAVRGLQAGGHVVAMVGDGVNDAPALAAADVGIAMGSGTDVAMHAAGITLMRPDVALVGAALDIAGRTVAKIRQNLFWAFVYNVAGIPLAAFGLLSPVVAGAAMALSSVSVMANALLLRRWKP
jgi:Cu+-exporting ATPase